MTEEKNPSPPPALSVEERIDRLQRKRAAIMDLPPEDKKGEILSFPQPAALVHAFAEQDFLFLVEEIGAEDALDLIALASDRQWEHLLDTRIWQRDRLDVTGLTRWLHRLFRADAGRTVRYLANERVELLELYLLRNINILIRDPEQAPTDLPQGYFTFDDTFYMQIPEDGDEDDDTDADLRPRFLRELLGQLAATDHIQLQRILLETIRILPAEVEEEEWRQRGTRMAEKGFLPFDEAVGIYQPLDPKAVLESPPLSPKRAGGAVRPSVPLYPVRMMAAGNLFSQALAIVAVPEAIEPIQTEFAALCNRLVVADRESVCDRDQLAKVVEKACGYLDLGLSLLLPETAGKDPGRAATLIRRHGLEPVFRVGFGACLKLKWRAETWRRQSWFAAAGLPLAFWDEAWTGVLGGLLIKKPLFFDNYETGDALYREFAKMADLSCTGAVLEKIIAVDGILSKMAAGIRGGGDSSPVTWKSLLLTGWLRGCIGLDETASPLDMDQLRSAFDRLWPETDRLDFASNRVKADFLNWLAGRAGLAPAAVSEKIGAVLEDLFTELAEEYGRVARAALDPRFVRHILLHPREP